MYHLALVSDVDFSTKYFYFNKIDTTMQNPSKCKIWTNFTKFWKKDWKSSKTQAKIVEYVFSKKTKTFVYGWHMIQFDEKTGVLTANFTLKILLSRFRILCLFFYFFFENRWKKSDVTAISLWTKISKFEDFCQKYLKNIHFSQNR